MVDWLKFYFLGFFSHGLSRQSSARSALNSLLSVFLTFILLFGGLIAGYSASFPSFYSRADEFKEFLYAAFADGNSDKRIDVEVKDGKFAAYAPTENGCVNGFTDGNAYGLNDYVLVVDTRPAGQVFDDFNVRCTDADGKEISVEDYRKLSDADKQKASFKLEYTGKELDVTQKQGEYLAFLDRVADKEDEEYSEKHAAEYAEIKEKRNSGELDEAAYARAVYELFVKAYYPPMGNIETYAAAPTLRTFYMTMGMSVEHSKTFLLLDDVCICSFTPAEGIRIDFGSYLKLKDGVISADGLDSAQMRDNVDGLVLQAFKSSTDYNVMVYLINVIKAMFLIVVAAVMIAFGVFAVCRFGKADPYMKFVGALKTVFSFMLVPAFLVFFAALGLSFALPRNSVYLLSEAAIVAAVALRAAVYCIMTVTENRRKRLTDEK